ncbi:predicted aminoglycoside phosphotransferase [Sanguibacter keddieii DSM 10542]|uniref:Predicted aminoglycoside phosphotransferase n=1 Tax=Sanguibacter keddieii (strain ATCC 51767 / DSM 10542 / NCFB 3025 / ST-74) TaxID=446469 RepID=D1BGA9_SANKS|nr:phosphotransferase [Sanguibacter keddieii]ACZ23626.1 predicted aminoglycoside phosphotransferase [Sanguibacter keddieii DSM 10542]
MSDGADETERETQDARALRVVRELGATPTTVDRLGGVVNVVLRVVGDDVDWVVRSPVDPRRPDEFPVERWAVEAARTCGVPVPEVLHVGVSRGIPVMVSRYVEPAAEPVARPWWWLGRHASSVAEADLTDAPDGVFSRFGRDLDHAWAAHLDYNQTALGPDDPLLADGAYQPDDLPTLRRWLHDLDDLETSQGLVHGDLAPRNLVSQGADVAPVLLDWGSATTGPAPWTELQRSFHAVVVDRELPWSTLVDLADGTGTPLDDTTLRTLHRMTALRLLDLARWARDQRADLYPTYRDSCAAGLAVLQACRG